MHRILIVEDDRIIAQAICRHISAWGCEARCVENFENVLGDFADFDPHLVLLDISLPFFNGYHWCGEIRRLSKAPIIFISSASDNLNIVMAMNMGGDDFIAKPFDLAVLTAKVQALLRRAYDFVIPVKLLESSGAVLNVADASLTFDGQKTELTKNEFKILQLLFENKGRIVSRGEMMTHLWEGDSFVDENTLSVNVNRLRRKLEDTGLRDFILTKKGLGYTLGD